MHLYTKAFLLVLVVCIGSATARCHVGSDSKCWDQELLRLLGEVESDPDYLDILSNASTYAKQQVASHKDAIKSNLAANQIKGFDLLWPPTGYAAVAAGGHFEVLRLLAEEEGLFDIGNIMGASGGAGSAFLALAGSAEEHGRSALERILKYNMVYAQWAEEVGIWRYPREGLRETPLWTAIYRYILQDSAAFFQVQRRGWCAMNCGLDLKNWVITDFNSTEQAALSYYATGDASAHGAVVGTEIPGLSDWNTRCSDGGSLTFVESFGTEGFATLFYNTYYSCCVMKINKATISFLMRTGIDETIQLLTSSNLFLAPHLKESVGGMQVVKPGSDGRVSRDAFAAFEKTDWGGFSPKVKCSNVFDGTTMKTTPQNC